MNTAMPGIVSYSLHAAILTAAFYIFWRLLLGKETLHRLNRVVLVLTPLVSLILPLCVITIHRIEYVDLTGEVAATGHQEQASAWHSVILAAYMIGSVLVVLKTVYSAARIWRIVRKGEKQVLEDGSLMVVTEKDVPPFSWMRYIILSRKDFEAGNPELLFH